MGVKDHTIAANTSTVLLFLDHFKLRGEVQRVVAITLLFHFDCEFDKYRRETETRLPTRVGRLTRVTVISWFYSFQLSNQSNLDFLFPNPIANRHHQIKQFTKLKDCNNVGYTGSISTGTLWKKSYLLLCKNYGTITAALAFAKFLSKLHSIFSLGRYKMNQIIFHKSSGWFDCTEHSLTQILAGEFQMVKHIYELLFFLISKLVSYCVEHVV